MAANTPQTPVLVPTHNAAGQPVGFGQLTVTVTNPHPALAGLVKIPSKRHQTYVWVQQRFTSGQNVAQLKAGALQVIAGGCSTSRLKQMAKLGLITLTAGAVAPATTQTPLASASTALALAATPSTTPAPAVAPTAAKAAGKGKGKGKGKAAKG
jgi:hypothetical protein